jgi:2-C-methyl-D-erythritol 4-phosphate cytidylyltransferase
MQKFVLIVAGGTGLRMESAIHKQFVELNGMPLLMHTAKAFSYLSDAEFVLVLPKMEIKIWAQLCIKHQFNIPHQLVEGGPKRFHSVKNGLQKIPDDVLVAIHDGVRPLVARETINRCFDLAKRKGNAVASIPIDASVREVDGSLNKPVNRSNLRMIQTPQVFLSTQIKKAYNQAYREEFTDDATVLESIGRQIHLTEGDSENIKITRPVDLLIAEKIIQIRES